MTLAHPDRARRFITLIDELYEADVASPVLPRTYLIACSWEKRSMMTATTVMAMTAIMIPPIIAPRMTSVQEPAAN